jgi:hypothetical protein
MNVWASDALYRWEQIVPAVLLPRRERGIDYSSGRVLLVEHGTRQIYWQLGHTGWVCLGQTGYYPASLEARDSSDPWGGVGSKPLFEGGHCSRGRLKSHWVAIAQHLQIPPDALPPLSRNRTFRFVSKRDHKVS